MEALNLFKLGRNEIISKLEGAYFLTPIYGQPVNMFYANSVKYLLR